MVHYSIEENQEIFEELSLQCINRDGIEDLLHYLTETDFYIAPSSTKYHLSQKGGLCQHSLNVFNRLFKIYNNQIIFPNISEKYELQTIAIVSLFHDLCKINVYKKSYRNVKKYITQAEAVKYQTYQVKSDKGGIYIWDTEESYIFDELLPLGHGEKSLYLVQKYLPVTEDEALAIRYHMGAYREEDIRNLSKVYEKCPLAFALHVADTLAVLDLES